MSYSTRVSNRLASRRPGECYRVWVSTRRAPYIAFESANALGMERFAKVLSRVDAKGPASSKELHAWARVDADGRLVLFGPDARATFLPVLAKLVARRRSDTAGLMEFCDTGVVEVDIDLDEPKSIESLTIESSDVVRDDSAWDDVRGLSVAVLAEVLAEGEVGTEYWVHLAPDADPPLLWTEVDADPSGSSLRAGIDLENASGVRSIGKAVLTQEGLDIDLKPVAGLEQVVVWVRAHVETHPALGRLAGLTFRGVAPPELSWEGVPVPFQQNSLAELASSLDMGPGTVAWFWTSTMGRHPLMIVGSQAADPDAEAFNLRMAALQAGAGVRKSVLGTVRTLDDGGLLFTAVHGPTALWMRAAGALLEHHPDTFSRLSSSRFVRVEGGAIVDATHLVQENTP